MKKAFHIGIMLLVVMGLAFSASAGEKKKVHKKVSYKEFKRIDEKKGGFTKHFEESVFSPTEKGLFSIEVLLIDGTVHVGYNYFDIVIHDDADEDVKGAKVVVSVEEVDTYETAKKKARGKIPGLYEVKKLDVEKEGNWQMTVTVKKGKDEDFAVFDFNDVK